jgi:hypothetical protein
MELEKREFRNGDGGPGAWIDGDLTWRVDAGGDQWILMNPEILLPIWSGMLGI